MRTLSLLLAAAGALSVAAPSTPARADWADHDGWRRHERREHQWEQQRWREHEWRERAWQSYAPPPVVYAPGPPAYYAPPPPAYYVPSPPPPVVYAPPPPPPVYEAPGLSIGFGSGFR